MFHDGRFFFTCYIRQRKLRLSTHLKRIGCSAYGRQGEYLSPPHTALCYFQCAAWKAASVTHTNKPGNRRHLCVLKMHHRVESMQIEKGKKLTCPQLIRSIFFHDTFCKNKITRKLGWVLYQLGPMEKAYIWF